MRAAIGVTVRIHLCIVGRLAAGGCPANHTVVPSTRIAHDADRDGNPLIHSSESPMP